MPEPTARQVHIDTALTNVSIGYSNAEYIGTGIFPLVRVAKITNKYFTFPKAAWQRDETGVRAPGARAKLADYTLSTDSYVCIERALAKLVPDEVVDNADAPLQPFIQATNYVTDQVLKAQEKDILDLVFGTGWASSATPSVLWTSDSAVPLTDIETAVNTVASSIGRVPNTGIIGRGLWRYLKNAPDVVERIVYSGSPQNPAKVTLAGVAALLELDRLMVATAVIDSGNEGQAASVGYIAGNHMWIGYVNPAPALDMPSAGYLFTYKDREVSRFRDDPAHTGIVECRASWDVKVTAADAGYLIKSAA